MGEEAADFRAWHRYASARQRLPEVFNAGDPTLTRLRLQQVVGLEAPGELVELSKFGARVEMCVSVTLFHRATRSLLGKTQSSPALPITKVLEPNCEFVFVSDADGGVSAIVEVAAQVRIKGLVQRAISVGWALLPLVGAGAGDEDASQRVQLLHGTPRVLLFQDLPDKPPAIPGATLEVSVTTSRNENMPALLMHELWLSSKPVPASNAAPINLEIQAAAATPTDDFLAILLSELEHSAAHDYGDALRKTPTVRRVLLRLIPHNGHVPLASPIELPLSLVDNSFAFQGSSTFQGLPLSPGLFLVIEARIEVDLAVPISDKALSELTVTRSIVAGWHAFRPFPNIDEGPRCFDEYLLPGPGRSVDGDLVFSGRSGRGPKRGICRVMLQLATPGSSERPLFSRLSALQRTLMQSVTSGETNADGAVPVLPLAPARPSRSESRASSRDASTSPPPTLVREQSPRTPAPPVPPTPPAAAAATAQATPAVDKRASAASKPPVAEEAPLRASMERAQPLSPRGIVRAELWNTEDVFALSRTAQTVLLERGVQTVIDVTGRAVPLTSTPVVATPDVALEADGRDCDIVLQLLGIRMAGSPSQVVETAHARLQFFTSDTIETSPTTLRAADDVLVFTNERSGEAGVLLRFSARYLSSRHLHIEIIDSERLLHVGSSHVPLCGLLRQRRLVAQIAGEFELLSSSGRPIGRLLVRIANIAKPYTGGAGGEAALGKMKRRAIRPIGDVHMDEFSETHYKKIMAMRQIGVLRPPLVTANTNLHGPPDMIEAVRSERRAKLLAALATADATAEVTLYPTQTNAVLVEHVLHNPVDADEVFDIELDDPQHEFGLVTDSNEWKTLAAVHKRAPPPRVERDMFSTERGVLLHGGETLPVPFRFLTLAAELSPARTISVKFTGRKHGTVSILVVHVMPQTLSIDRTLYFDARESEVLRRRVILPTGPQPGRVWCSSADVTATAVSLAGGGAAVDLRLRVGPSPSTRSFNVVLCDDTFCGRVRETWRVVVQSLKWLDVRTLAGQLATTSLVLRGGETARRVRAFSSEPDLLTVVPDHEFDLGAGPEAISVLTLNYRPLHAGTHDVRLNIVDVNTRELADAWLVALVAAAPTPTKTYDVHLPRGVASSKRIALHNPYPEQTTYTICTDSPRRLFFKNDTVSLAPHGSGSIGLRFTDAEPLAAVETVLVFLTDTAGKIDECLCVRVHYDAVH